MGDNAGVQAPFENDALLRAWRDESKKLRVSRKRQLVVKVR